MVCKECGKYFDDDVAVCDECGKVQDIPEGKIQVLYHNNQLVYVDPPVMTEVISITNNNTKERSRKLKVLVPSLLVAASFIMIFSLLFLPLNNSSKVEYRNIQNDFNSTVWNSGEFMLDGFYYRLGDPYKKLESNDWKYRIEEYSFLEDYTLDVEEKYPSYINLYNKKYLESNVKIQFINNSSIPKEINKCWINGLIIDNISLDEQVKFSLPGDIHNGSSLEDITNAYGKIDDSLIKIDEINKYKILEYNESHLHLSLTLVDGKGLQKIELYRY